MLYWFGTLAFDVGIILWCVRINALITAQKRRLIEQGSQGDTLHVFVPYDVCWELWEGGVPPLIGCQWLPGVLAGIQFLIMLFCISGQGFVEHSKICLSMYSMVLLVYTLFKRSTIYAGSPRDILHLSTGESSSATSSLTTATEFVLMTWVCLFCPVGIMLKAISLLIGVFGVASNLAVGNHYTADVLVAIYLSSTVFMGYHQRFMSSWE